MERGKNAAFPLLAQKLERVGGVRRKSKGKAGSDPLLSREIWQEARGDVEQGLVVSNPNKRAGSGVPRREPWELFSG